MTADQLASSSPTATCLPPRYRAHLRTLLRQWIDQQTTELDGVPGPSDSRQRLWTVDRAKELEDAVWKTTMGSQADTQGKGLLDVDWERWIVRAMRRITEWQQEREQRPSNTDTTPHATDKTVRNLRRATASDTDVSPRGRTSRSNTSAIPKSGSSSATPTKTPTRPPSVASNRSSSRADSIPNQLTAKLHSKTSESLSDHTESGDVMNQLCQRLAQLKGFTPLSPSSGEEWEVVQDQSAPPPSQPLPGAFPQSGQFDEVQSPSLASRPRQMAVESKTVDCELLKPVFCLHFPTPLESYTPSNTSTVRLTRNSSSGSITAAGTWWGSGRRWSEMTVRAAHPTEQLDVTFVEGRFALPVARNLTRSSSLSASDSSCSMAVGEDALVSRVSETSGSDPDIPFGEGGDGNPANRIIGGAMDDIPSAVDPDDVGLVGGTFVVSGMTDKEERQAIERILQRILYTIQSMVIEISLLRAFRVPEESEPSTTMTTTFEARADSPSTTKHTRRRSLKETGVKPGFLDRLHRDTRGVFGGLFGSRRNTIRDDIEEDESSLISPRSSTFHSLGVPPAPMSMTQHGTPMTPDKSIPLDNALQGTSSVPSSIDTHVELLNRLSALKTSTTPGLELPPPVLLTRVKDEDQRRKDNAHQCTTPSRPSSGTATPISHDQESRPSSYRLGGDVRVGLKAIRAGLDTFDGWTRLQRLDTVQCSISDSARPDDASRVAGDDQNVTSICGKPSPQSFVFFDMRSDSSLVSFLHRLQTEKGDTACPRSECSATNLDRERCWYHGDKKVTLRAHQAWISCKTCGTSSDSRTVTDLAACYSFGKFLELLIYTDILRPAHLCNHKGPDILVHHLRSGGISVAISVESSPVLNTRLPQLQVGPSVQKRKPASGAIESALQALVPNDTIPPALAVLKEEFDAYYKGLSEIQTKIIEIGLSADTAEEKEKRDSAFESLVNGLTQTQCHLEKLLDQTPASLLNDVRAAFVKTIRGNEETVRRFLKDHKVAGEIDLGTLRLPPYYDGTVHALPGGHLLVKEDDPASIIAYTLSSLAYMTELTPQKGIAEDKHGKPASVTTETSSSPGWLVDVKRRDNPKDLFALRSLTKKQTNVATTPSKPFTAMAVTPTIPSLELSLEQVHTWSDPSDNLSELVKSIHKAAAQDPVLSVKARSPNLGRSSPSEDQRDAADRGSPVRSSRRLDESADGLPPLSLNPPSSRSVSSTGTTVPVTPQFTEDGSEEHPEGWGSTFSNAFYRVGETLGSFKMRTGERSLSSMLGPLSAMSQADNSLANSASNRLPHIQFTYTLGDKLKLGCTVYHAEPFDSLRRRCAIDKEIIASLSRVENWDVSGGKSKALFFRTEDRRYVIKELVSKWTVSDTNAMLELSPQYFEYMQNTFNKATSLIKIVGFYSVTTHDRQSGVKKQMDLLIMEDLFHKQEISQTFDLKGIEGRKVPKPTAPTSTASGETKIVSPETLFDADWMESMARSPILLYPHAKRILTEAIAADTKFLSAQSVMDYSLLLGLDSGKRELVVGIVDSIGSFNLWKTIESRGKQALTRTGEVTVIPPDQYKERFENALNNYFIACPDKWSKTGRKHAGPLTSFI